MGVFIIFLPPLVLLSLILFYAYLFTLRTGGSLLPSVLAQRDFVFYLLGPIIYMLHMRGWKLADFQHHFVLAASLTVADHLIAYFLMVNPELWFRQGLSGEQGAWAFDAPLHVAVRAVQVFALFAILYCVRKFLWSRGVFALVIKAGMMMASLVLLTIDISRVLSSSAILALIFYALFLAGAKRMRFSTIVLPVLLSFMILVAPYLGSIFVETFSQDQSYEVRLNSVESAWSVVQEHPWVGYGVASSQSITLQSVTGDPYFQAADVGLLGVALQYGIVGLLLYMYLTVWLFLNMLKLFWKGVEDKGRDRNVFLWALLIICLTLLIASPVQAKFVYREGIVFAAFCWGLIMANKHGLPSGIYEDSPRYIQPLMMRSRVHNTGAVRNK